MGILQVKVYKTCITYLDELKQRLRNEWAQLDHVVNLGQTPPTHNIHVGQIPGCSAVLMKHYDSASMTNEAVRTRILTYLLGSMYTYRCNGSEQILQQFADCNYFHSTNR